MKSYLSRCRESLVPKSKADDLLSAFEEWEFNDNIIDHGDACEVCHLCGHKPLRWHFEIRSRETDETMMVGSECIKRFGAHRERLRAKKRGVEDEDELDSIAEKARSDIRSMLREKQKEYRRDMVVESLRRLWSAEDSNSNFRSMIESIAKSYKKDPTLSPNQAKVIGWRASEHDVDVPFEHIKIDLAKKRYKRQMRSMDDWKIKQFWDALSSTQQQRAHDRGWYRR